MADGLLGGRGHQHVSAMARRGEPGGGAALAFLPPVPPFLPALAHHRDWEWSLRTFLELGALPGAVPCARLHARQVLWEWRLTRLSDSVELLVSELITNAVDASRSMTQMVPVRLWLLASTAQVMVMVWDASSRPPVRAQAGEDAESGRGLLLVEAMSVRWDWYFPQEGSGKVVWALAADGCGGERRG
jgi:anti-sigma regulatory factor (Ser/Thr protein kinase)